MYWLGEIAHQMALLPLAWLAWLRLRGQSRDRAYWVLALAFAVSWVADLVSDFLQPDQRWLVSLAYPITQAGLIGAAFLTRGDALILASGLLAAGMVACMIGSARAPDVLLRSVAWLGVAGIVADRKSLGLLRASLMVYFGLGWLAWVWYSAMPGWTTWGTYQATRLAGLLLFCRAVVKPAPALRLA